MHVVLRLKRSNARNKIQPLTLKYIWLSQPPEATSVATERNRLVDPM
jgi:hypothetical protein